MSVTASGPLFDGTLARRLEEAEVRIEERIGEEAIKLFKAESRGKFKNPTGRYISSLETIQVGASMLVKDFVEYGLPLEKGRSGSTFRGYHIWRSVRAKLNGGIAEKIAEEEVAKAINGAG